MRDLVESTTVHVVAFRTRSSSLSRESGTDILGSFWPSSRIYVPSSVLACRAKMILLLFLALPVLFALRRPSSALAFSTLGIESRKAKRGNRTKFEAANLWRRSPRFGEDKRVLRKFISCREILFALHYLIILSNGEIERISRTVNVA